MEKEFVSYEQALALRELGFNEVCFRYYEKGILSDYLFDKKINHNPKCLLPAPLYQQAFRFFRERYGLGCYVESFLSGDYDYCITHPISFITTGRIDYGGDVFDTYEQAEQAALDKLIEIAKQQNNEN